MADTLTSRSKHLRVLLIEPYYAGSHRSWADGVATHSRHAVSLITHEAEFWRWRMRGGAVTLAELIRDEIARNGPADVVLVSDMVDLAGLIGHCRSFVGNDTAWVLYCHENQLVHPLGPRQQPDEGLSLINWTSMHAADEVWFNSEFLRGETLTALRRFLNRQPDRKHLHLIDGVEQSSQVVPVGVATSALIAADRTPTDPPTVLWNQRWDHDKNPGAVFRALVKLAADDVSFNFALAGENQRVDPQEFTWVQEQLGDRMVHAGHADSDRYRELLLSADVVVSAAHHEFFGIAIIEAVAAGAVPVLPNRQSYPEVMPVEHHDAVLYADGDLRTRLHTVLGDVTSAHGQVTGLRESMGRWDWSAVAPSYDSGFERVAAEVRG